MSDVVPGEHASEMYKLKCELATVSHRLACVEGERNLLWNEREGVRSKIEAMIYGILDSIEIDPAAETAAWEVQAWLAELEADNE